MARQILRRRPRWKRPAALPKGLIRQTPAVDRIERTDKGELVGALVIPPAAIRRDSSRSAETIRRTAGGKHSQRSRNSWHGHVNCGPHITNQRTGRRVAVLVQEPAMGWPTVVERQLDSVKPMRPKSLKMGGLKTERKLMRQVTLPPRRRRIRRSQMPRMDRPDCRLLSCVTAGGTVLSGSGPDAGGSRMPMPRSDWNAR